MPLVRQKWNDKTPSAIHALSSQHFARFLLLLFGRLCKPTVEGEIVPLLRLVWLLSFPHVLLWVLAQVEESGTVHVLEGRLVVVAQSQLVLGLHEKLICSAKMPEVMTERCHKEGILL